MGEASEVAMVIRGVPVTYSAKNSELRCLDKKAGLPMTDGRVRLRLLIDRASIEIFANEGQLYMPMGSVLDQRKPALVLTSSGGNLKQLQVSGFKLKSIWPSR